jgi:16S rRNA (guanine527-N7)-methyltransferase
MSDRRASAGAKRRTRVADRLDALASRYRLADAAVARLGVLLGLLLSDPLAPTAIRDPTKAIDDHLADSLVALELEAVRSASHAVDIGSGAGLPGLPLAIALPATRFTLLESAARKCAFLERAAAACGLSNVTVAHARAEASPDGLGRHDLVTARALGPLPVVAEYAAPLLRVGGTLVAWRGRRDAEAEAAAARAAEALGLSGPEIVPVQPYEGARHRHLYLMSKLVETPRGFPRRPGMALKRPLGLSDRPSR